MVASPEVIADNAELLVMEMSQRMEALVAAGDWDEVEDIIMRIRSTVMNVPEANRRAVVIALQRSTEKVSAEAKIARQTVTGKISELRRGQVAKKAYELR